MIQIIQAETCAHLQALQVLFEEYVASLDFDLSFQNFTEEYANLPGSYAPPNGRLLLAHYSDQATGCVALRKLADGICEMKRLYVRPQYRRLRIGKALAEAVIIEARKAGYEVMRLDTVPSMAHAQVLYELLGFRDIPPYCHNPIEGARFMELRLDVRQLEVT